MDLFKKSLGIPTNCKSKTITVPYPDAPNSVITIFSHILVKTLRILPPRLSHSAVESSQGFGCSLTNVVPLTVKFPENK